jgi:preprotein translocase subunit SecD
MRPGRQLAVLGALFVVLYLLVFFVNVPKGEDSFMQRLEPRLGLDLVGGTQVTFEAVTGNGQAPPPENLETARGIMEERVNALGVSEAEVVIEGDRNIVISKAGESNEAITQVGDAAELRFRKVLKATGDTGPPQPQPQPSANPSAAPSGQPSAKPSAPAVNPAPSTGGQGGGAPAPASPSPSAPAASPSAAAPSAPAAPLKVNSRGPLPTEDAVRKKVGEAAWKAATALQAPADATQTPVLAPFETLTGDEVSVLKPEMQFNVPAISCDQLNARRAGSIQDEKAKVVACQPGTKFYLDVAKVVGEDVDGADAVLDQNSKWVVSLDFTSDGQDKWTELTREAFNNTNNACDQSALGDQGRCLVAVVLDKEVVSAPQINGVLTGQSQIEGDFSPAEANTLADQLRFGALPLTFEQRSVDIVSATLGTVQLQAGLLAAGIGMLLVAIYSFFYYRLLGSVIFLSLILSALLTFGALVVLGRGIGFTLSLAGIAGFIVSLGVAADSFVIYFERLKDEIRDGRSPRSAVPRAWARARRTIISANAITILAAVVLYVVSIGVVQGFAFALGLSTILDLVVVFLFRHPIMTMFARTKAFMSPRVSGLGRVMHHATPDEAPVRKSRVKEA